MPRQYQPNAIDEIIIDALDRTGLTNWQIAAATGHRLTKETVRNVREARHGATTATLAKLAPVIGLELRRKPKPRVKR